MVKLTCLIRRKAGMSPEEFHAYWRDHHGPLVLSTQSGSHVLRYEQHHRALSDYGPDDDGQYDGVTEQWFESMDEYQAHIAEKDFAVGVGGPPRNSSTSTAWSSSSPKSRW